MQWKSANTDLELSPNADDGEKRTSIRDEGYKCFDKDLEDERGGEIGKSSEQKSREKETGRRGLGGRQTD